MTMRIGARLSKGPGEGGATEALALDDAVIGISESEFEDVFGEVDGDAHGRGVCGGLAIGGSIHGGLLWRSRELTVRKSVWLNKAEWRNRGSPFDHSSRPWCLSVTSTEAPPRRGGLMRR